MNEGLYFLQPTLEQALAPFRARLAVERDRGAGRFDRASGELMLGHRPLLITSFQGQDGFQVSVLDGGLGGSLIDLSPRCGWMEISPTVPGWWQVCIQSDQASYRGRLYTRDRVLTLYCHGGLYTYTPGVNGEPDHFDARPWTGRELIPATSEQVRDFIESRRQLCRRCVTSYAGETPFLGSARPALPRDRATPYLTLPPDLQEMPHCRIRVYPNEVLDLATLESWFSPNSVFTGLARPECWSEHPARASVDATYARERIVLAKRFTPEELATMEEGLSEDAVLEWGKRHGLVPSNRQETCAFATHPHTRDLSRRGNVIAFGDVFAYKGRPEEVLGLTSDNLGHGIGVTRRNNQRFPTEFFLFTLL